MENLFNINMIWRENRPKTKPPRDAKLSSSTESINDLSYRELAFIET